MSRRIKPTSTFIKRFMNANHISQRDVCVASGYSEKQVSLIMHDKLPVSQKFAYALEKCIPGLQAEFVLNYSKRYQEQLKEDEIFLKKNNYNEIAKKLKFTQVFKHITSDPVEQTNIMLNSYSCSNLTLVPDLIKTSNNNCQVVFSKDQSKVDDTDNIVVEIWTKAVINQILLLENKKQFAGPEKARKILYENKDLLSTTNSNELISNIHYICDECGIHVAFTHAAPTSYIRGLSFSNDGQIFILLTDRYKKIEYVVFAFVHEMMHIINGDVNTEGSSIRIIALGEEHQIDSQASEYLIESKIYDRIKSNPSLEDLFKVAEESQTSIGIVVAKYHYETKDYQKYWQFLNNFNVKNDLFDN